MASATISELAKNSEAAGDYLASAVYDVFGEESAFMRSIPIRDISGGGMDIKVRTKLPGVSTRKYNEDFTPSVGKTTMLTETLAILGGSIKIDTAQRQVEKGFEDDDPFASELKGKARAVARQVERLWFQGDYASNQSEFDGFKKRLSDPTSAQLIPVKDSATNGGDPLTLTAMDRLLLSVRPRPTLFAMSEDALVDLNTLIRNTGSAMEMVDDGFGTLVKGYGGVPIVTILEDENDESILAYNEVGKGGATATATSIYAFHFDAEKGVGGIQNGRPMVLPTERDGVFDKGLLQWLFSPMEASLKAASRLYGIKKGVS